MIDYIFKNKGRITEHEKEAAKKEFEHYLGEFKDEFIRNHGVVTIYLDESISSGNRYSYLFRKGDDDMLTDFIKKFKAYKGEFEESE